LKGVAARGSAQLGIEGAFAAITGYIGLLLLAHSLGPAEFGLWRDHLFHRLGRTHDDARHSRSRHQN
jgi:hypothetical protein